MASWVNRVVIAAPRNGTSSHTVDPSSATNVVAGAAFTPTAGRLLVVIVEGSVTSTTPSGWTLPTSGSAVNNTGLYVWYRTAAGGDTFTTTHNGSNYPLVFEVLEFAAGSTFVKSAAATGVSYTGGAGPTLSGLTGTNDLIAVAGQGLSNSVTETVSWSAGTKTSQVSVPNVSTDGYTYSTSVLTDSTLTSWSSAATFSGDGGFGFTAERLVFAVNGAAGSSSDAGTLSASVPKLTGAISGTARNAAVLAASVPLVVASISGTATDAGSVQTHTPSLTSAVAGTSRNTGALSASTPLLTAQISDQTRNAATLSAHLPLLTAAARGTSSDPGAVSAALFVPVSTIAGTSTDPASIAAALPTVTGSLSGTATNPGALSASTPRLTGSVSDAVPHDITVTASLDARRWSGALAGRTKAGQLASRRWKGSLP